MIRLGVADTGPIRYLVLIGHIEVLPQLFSAIAIPASVAMELCHANAPAAVRGWLEAAPLWIKIHPDPAEIASSLTRLDPGERAAIALAQALAADRLLIDDRAGVSAARALGVRSVGTLAVLIEAASRDLLSLADAFNALRATNFHCSSALLDALLAEHG